MKNILFLLVAVSVSNFSCKKEDVHKTDTNVLVGKIEAYLKDSLAQKDFNHLNFSKINVCNYSKDLQTVIVPFLYDSVESKHFVALRIEKDGYISTGKIINLSLDANKDKSLTRQKKGTANGEISISSLNRTENFYSPIIDGYITGFYPDVVQSANGTFQSIVDPYQNLPEVVVVAYLPSYSGSSGPWINLLSMFGMQGNGDTYYQSFGDYYGDSGGSGGGSGGGGYIPTIPMQVDFETDYNKDAIDIAKYIKCFDAIPDAGSMTSITILTDIPVDNDPNVFFNWEDGSPGHSFIRLYKSNGSQHVQQIIGFYPVNNWKTVVLPDPIDAKFVDNGQHEFNASIRMTLSPQDFRNTLDRLKYLAQIAKYDIDEFNCTDLALDVFNQSRGGNPLIIIPAILPGGGGSVIESNTPQGLYQKLKIMKEQGNPESGNINMPAGKAFEGLSDGPCN